MADVGINIKVAENLSNLAPLMVNQMRGISSAANEMKESLQLGDMGDRYKDFTDRVNKLHDVQRQSQMRASAGGAAGAYQLAQLPRGAAGIAGRLGGSGDAMGAGADVISQLGGVLKPLGPIGGILMALGGTAALVNTLSQQYEKAIPTVMDMTGALGKLKGTSDEMSFTMRKTMADVSNAGAVYGYTLEESANIITNLARTGGISNTGAMQNVMGYARGFSMDTGFLGRYQATGQRFGVSGGGLGFGVGAAQGAGLNEGRYQEFMNATLSIFEEGLSRGVVKGFDDIQQMQIGLGGLGEQFQGQTGLNIYRRLESGVTGATNLSSEGDALLFRAAQNLVKEEAGKGGSYTYIDVMKKLEKGISGDLFDQVMGMVNNMTTTDPERVEKLRSIFSGLGYTEAEMLLGLKGDAGADIVNDVKPPTVEDTSELSLKGVQLEMVQQLRSIASSASDLKLSVMDGAQFILDGLEGVFGINEQNARKQREVFFGIGGESEQMTLRTNRKMMQLGLSSGDVTPFAEIMKMIDQSMNQQGMQSTGFLAAKTMLSGSNLEDLLAIGMPQMQKIIDRAKSETSMGGEGLQWRDMPQVLLDLTQAIKDMKELRVFMEEETPFYNVKE